MRIGILLLFIIPFLGNAQDPLRFKKQVDSIIEVNQQKWDSKKETIIFVGSSSIYFWQDLQERFPEHQILNCGFGGSHASDLEYYLDDLVMQFNPTKVFIYEGDNDVFHKKKNKEILASLKRIVARINAPKPIEIVLISAKPSISRWNLRKKYKRLNKKLQAYAMKTSRIAYIDVWNIMVDNKKLNTSIFIEDGLHLNKKGYDLWQTVFAPHMSLNKNHATAF